MNREDEERIRSIVRDELAAFLHKIEIEAGEPMDFAGDTKTARGLLRLLFVVARDRSIKEKLSSGEIGGE
jgi:hypothetical protein